MFNDMRQIVTFTHVAELGSFAKAAKKLDISPAIVSHHVSQLEERFDVALLYRSTRRLTLTDAGRALAEKGHNLLIAAESASELLQGESTQHRGVLRLAAPTVYENQLTKILIPEFLKNYPEVDLQIVFSDLRLDLIRDGYDLALRFGPQSDTSLVARKLFSGIRYLCATPELAEQLTFLEKPQQLSGVNSITHQHYITGWKFRSKTNRRVLISAKPRKRITVNSLFSAYKLVQMGTGVGVLPDFLFEPAQARGELVCLLPDWSPEEYEAFLVWPRASGSNPITRLFVESWIRQMQGKLAI